MAALLLVAVSQRMVEQYIITHIVDIRSVAAITEVGAPFNPQVVTRSCVEGGDCWLSVPFVARLRSLSTRPD